MPCVADRTPCTAGCDQKLSRRTVRQHLNNGCPGSARRVLMRLKAGALAEHACLGSPGSPRGRRHFHRRNTPLTPPPPSIPRRANAQRHAVPSVQDAETGHRSPDLGFDARHWHDDFGYDTAGAGPSSRSPSPLLPPQAHCAPVPPEVVAAWVGDMSPEDYLSQQLHSQLAHEGGQ